MLDGLEEVDSELWRDVIELQRNWIGSVNGARFEFKLVIESKFDEETGPTFINEHFSVFTPSPEGLYGASHILVSSDHFLSQPQYHTARESDR